jgi:hypothetical protein
VSAAMREPGVNARDTTDCETPASAATSNEVALDWLRAITLFPRLTACVFKDLLRRVHG